MSDVVTLEMKISREAMKIARKVAGRKHTIKSIAQEFNVTYEFVESRIDELIHPTLIQTIKELV